MTQLWRRKGLKHEHYSLGLYNNTLPFSCRQLGFGGLTPREKGKGKGEKEMRLPHCKDMVHHAL
jgi:hypothetical protein